MRGSRLYRLTDAEVGEMVYVLKIQLAANRRVHEGERREFKELKDPVEKARWAPIVEVHKKRDEALERALKALSAPEEESDEQNVQAD